MQRERSVRQEEEKRSCPLNGVSWFAAESVRGHDDVSHELWGLLFRTLWFPDTFTDLALTSRQPPRTEKHDPCGRPRFTSRA